MKKISPESYSKGQDVSLILLRMTLGAIFLYAGVMKFAMWGMQPSAAMPEGMLMLMKFLAITETLGAIALIIGFLTRWAALGLLIIMTGAIALMQFMLGVGFATDTGAGWNFPLMVLGGCAVLMAFGSGKWSLESKVAWAK